ncbi:TetR family transcriptional regulator [Notoacmeibacter sp. MSK16QG-6]|nr:TetR family transcriptional regulator [Notoacmeibacter sp. MSK16QG-6]
MFFERGYDGATVRQIAEAVPIDPSMIIRYFGSKEQLFADATVVDLRFQDFGPFPGDDIGRLLIEHFLDLWENEDGDLGLAILLRSSAHNEEARTKIREIFAQQVIPLISRIDPLDAERRAGMIVSQLFGLALCRYILELSPISAMPRDDIVQIFGPTIQHYAVGGTSTA